MSRQSEVVVVTPEHVEIVLTPAGLGSRFLALTIDSMITLLLPALVVRLAGPALTKATAFALGTTLQFFFTFAYHVYFETRRQGRTIGKRALGLRVVDWRGLPVTAAQSLVRNAVRVLDSLPLFYAIGGLASLIDRSGRRLGDLVAQTLVVEERSPLAYQSSQLGARQFNSLRTPRILRLVRHRIGMEERELLLELSMRADQLQPQKRYQIMEEVGGHYRRLLGIDDTRLTGENLVRDLTSILFTT
ncbi:MAG TPA: RDD family protein [Thermoanaerobaculia bacterium]|nr:RDD family protein [Thermoanaerobaculia bacterium]